VKIKWVLLRFNFDDEIDKRVYNAISHLPEYFEEPNISKALINFINNLVSSLAECGTRNENCEALLQKFTGQGKHMWH
jgi:hypothetical protein